MHTKFTPGPWEPYSQEGETKSGRAIHSVCKGGYFEDHQCIAEAYGKDEAEAFANARIISSAPDLLAALQEIVAADDEQELTDEHINAARAAIARATGAA